MPVRQRSILGGLDVALSRTGSDARAARRAPPARPAAARRAAPRPALFHSPQPGQRPNHFGLSCPHEEQAKTVAERAMLRS